MDRLNGSDRVAGGNGRYYGLKVHQATGMVSVQANCSVAEALDLLVGYAGQHGCSVEQVASGVVDRRVRLDT